MLAQQAAMLDRPALDADYPVHMGSDDGPEMTAKAIPGWRAHIGAKTPFIEPGGR